MIEQEWGKEFDMLNAVCPDCAFSFCHIHTDADGSYSCPLCAEAALTAERDRYREALEKIARMGFSEDAEDPKQVQVFQWHLMRDIARHALNGEE